VVLLVVPTLWCVQCWFWEHSNAACLTTELT
jgi:hypothetical protein